MNTDRRRFLGLLAGVAAGGAGASALVRTGRADAGVTFAAGDVTVRTHDGALGALTVAPAGTVSWSGLEEPAGSVGLALYAKLDSALRYRELDGQRLDAAGLHGETEFRFETRDLLDGPGFSSGDFTPDDGENRTRTVGLRLGVTVYATDDETVLTTGYADATFDVTVENRPERGAVDGRANTGGEPENGGTTTETTEDTTTTAETTEEEATTATETTETTEETTTTTEDETTEETTEDGKKESRNKNEGKENKITRQRNDDDSEGNRNNVSERSDAVASLASAAEE